MQVAVVMKQDFCDFESLPTQHLGVEYILAYLCEIYANAAPSGFSQLIKYRQ